MKTQFTNNNIPFQVSSYMMSSTNVLFFRYTFISFIILNFCEAAIKLPNNVTIPAVIVFGDSILDQGNNNNIPTIAKCNFPPYGKDIFGGIPTGRFSNGRTPPDILAKELGIKEYVPAYLDPHLQPIDLPTGVSFASGATGYDPITPQLSAVFSMADELNMFGEYIGKLKELVGEERTNFIIENSFYLVVAGTNDILNSYFTSGVQQLHYDVNSYTDFVVKKATEFVMELYKFGAKRIAVFGDPPIGCLPSQRTLVGGLSRECNDKYNQAAQMYNSKLEVSLKALNHSLNDPKGKIVYIDIYNPLLALIQNYKNYGLKVANKGCCGTGVIEVAILCNKYDDVCSDDTSYLFWDSYHPSEHGYRLLVDLIIKAGIITRFI